MSNESESNSSASTGDKNWGPALFVVTLTLLLLFFWWVLFYSGGTTPHHG